MNVNLKGNVTKIEVAFKDQLANITPDPQFYRGFLDPLYTIPGKVYKDQIKFQAILGGIHGFILKNKEGYDESSINEIIDSYNHSGMELIHYEEKYEYNKKEIVLTMVFSCYALKAKSLVEEIYQTVNNYLDKYLKISGSAKYDALTKIGDMYFERLREDYDK